MGRGKKLLIGMLGIAPKPMVWPFAKKYIAGETLDDAVRVTRELNAEGCRATLDVLGEDIRVEAEAHEYVEKYLTAIERIRAEGLDANVSIKPTAMGLRFSRELTLTCVRRILERARDHGMTVRIDMEDSPVTAITLEIFRELRAQGFDNVGIVIQAYLRRTMDDARALAAEGASVRLCKGIYVEKREVAYKDFHLVRASYVSALEALLRGDETRTAIATHDDFLAFHGRRLVRELAVPKERYEFQMLLGVDPQLRRLLVAEGHPLRVYVPFGEGWLGYSLRRLVENPRLATHVTANVLGFGTGSE